MTGEENVVLLESRAWLRKEVRSGQRRGRQ